MSSYIKNNAILSHNARIAVHLFDVGGSAPSRALGITIPCLESLLGIGVLFPKNPQCFEGDHAHTNMSRQFRHWLLGDSNQSSFAPVRCCRCAFPAVGAILMWTPIAAKYPPARSRVV